LQELLETTDSNVIVNPNQKKTKKRKVRVLVFQGGSVVSMGLKSHREVDAVCKSMMQKLAVCRMKGSVSDSVRAQERINAQTKHIPIRNNAKRNAEPVDDVVRTKRALQVIINGVDDAHAKAQLQDLFLTIELGNLKLDDLTEVARKVTHPKRQRTAHSSSNPKEKNEPVEQYQDMPDLYHILPHK